MTALELAFANAQNNSNSGIDIEELESKALGITVDVLRMFKEGFRETYEVAKVHTLEYGHVLPAMRRESSLKGMSY